MKYAADWVDAGYTGCFGGSAENWVSMPGVWNCEVAGECAWNCEVVGEGAWNGEGGGRKSCWLADWFTYAGTDWVDAGAS